MKNTFPGYYPPSKEDFSTLWNNCVFMFDANVLLNLYRYTTSTTDELIGILNKISNRIWVPNQAALEYQKDRLNVISQQSEAYEKIQELLEDFQNKIENQLRIYRKHPLIDVENMINRIGRLFNAVKKEQNKNEKEHPDLIHSDHLRDTITSLFDGKVGSPYTEDRLEQIYKKGEKRYRQSIPPGFSDAKKEGTEKYGDLILWFQIIDKAKEIKKPIILVTDDSKEDWWYKFKGKSIGPHPKLVEEIKSEAGVLFYMYHTEPFMNHVQDYLRQKVEQKAIQEVREVQKSLEEHNAYQQEVSKGLEQMIMDGRIDTLAANIALSDLVSAKDNLASNRTLSDLANRNRTLLERVLAANLNIADLAKARNTLMNLNLTDLANRDRTSLERFLAANRSLTDLAKLNIADLAKARDTLDTEEQEIIQKGNTKKSDSEPNKESDE